MISTATVELGSVAAFLDALFPDEAKGKIVAAIGSGPRWSASGSYEHESWREQAFDYPDDENSLLDLLTAAVESGCDTYLCTGMSYNGTRTEAALKAIWNLHADWDGQPDDEQACIDKVQALGGFIIRSGTEGHLHCYVPLEEPITSSATNDRMAKAFHAKLPPGPEKFKWNDVLRIPGTVNLKETVRPGGSVRR